MINGRGLIAPFLFFMGCGLWVWGINRLPYSCGEERVCDRVGDVVDYYNSREI